MQLGTELRPHKKSNIHKKIVAQNAPQCGAKSYQIHAILHIVHDFKIQKLHKLHEQKSDRYHLHSCLKPDYLTCRLLTETSTHVRN